MALNSLQVVCVCRPARWANKICLIDNFPSVSVWYIAQYFFDHITRLQTDFLHLELFLLVSADKSNQQQQQESSKKTDNFFDINSGSTEQNIIRTFFFSFTCLLTIKSSAKKCTGFCKPFTQLKDKFDMILIRLSLGEAAFPTGTLKEYLNNYEAIWKIPEAKVFKNRQIL